MRLPKPELMCAPTNFSRTLLTHGKRVVLSSRIWPSLILSCVFMTTVIVPLSAFVRFISVSRFKALRASRSAGGRLFFGFVISISARSL